MNNETRLHEILDVIEQARAEGDTATEQRLIAAYKKESMPDVNASDRVQAAGSGTNAGIASLLGLPVDTAVNVWDLAKAGTGFLQSKLSGKPPLDAFDPSDRSKAFGSSQYIRNAMDKSPVTTTQPNRPEDTASQYLHTAGSALPGAALMRPTTVGQAMTAGAANVAPALASKVTADLSQGTRYENTAPVLANLLTQVGVNRAMAPKPPQKASDRVRIETLKNAQKEGYVVPPATTNPTVLNKLMESFGGKVATQQDAALRNTAVTDNLTRRALGLPDDTPLTMDELGAIRSNASKAYESVKGIGTITTDATYKQALADIASKYTKTSKAFPGLVNDDISGLVKSLDQPTFDADSAVEATKFLREKSSELYAKGDKSLGKAYKQASGEIEAMIERSLPPKSQILKDFRKARQEIAKSYSVERALNDATGHASAIDYGRQLKKNSPLTDELKTAGRFAQAFPKAAAPVNDSGSVRNTDVIIGGGVAAMSGEPAGLLYPFGRMAMRDRLLSDWGQKRAIPKPPKNHVQLQTPEQLQQMLMLNQLGLLSQ